MNRRTRLGAYAKSVDDGHILLVQISNLGHHPGVWTLPGGGLDFGEHPQDGLARELYEETGLAGNIERLLGIDSVVLPAERRPGSPELHWLRFIYQVATAGEPQVTEVDGTVADARWVPLEDVVHLPVGELVALALSME